MCSKKRRRSGSATSTQNAPMLLNEMNSVKVRQGPTFYPTIDDMEDTPLKFIKKISPIAQQYGICKIVPPDGWNPRFCKFADVFHSKVQHMLAIGV